MTQLYVLTRLSHYMASQFPGTKDSPPWQPIAISEPHPLAEVEGQLDRIRASHNGVMPTNCTFAIVKVK